MIGLGLPAKLFILVARFQPPIRTLLHSLLVQGFEPLRLVLRIEDCFKKLHDRHASVAENHGARDVCGVFKIAGNQLARRLLVPLLVLLGVSDVQMGTKGCTFSVHRGNSLECIKGQRKVPTGTGPT